jgi:hypothetical protein
MAPLRRRTRTRNEQGAVAIIVALSLTALLVACAMVLDFGLVRVDRQVDKSVADAATTAGLNGLNGGDGRPRPFRGVCTAVRFLRANDARFANVTSAAGTWTDGAGAGKANGCTDTGLQNQVCTPGSNASWARYSWTGTYQGDPLSVTIQSGYSLQGTTGWREDTLAAAAADSNDTAQGCDQLAVVIRQNRKPGLGSLATSADLVSSIRTVGRVKAGPGGDAPAMLLLKRTGCPVLSTGSNGGGSYIHVYGAVSAGGRTQPGSIHSDSDGSGCSGGIFQGKAGNGVVSYAAPTAGNPSVADSTKPGQITSVAGANGVSIGTVRDSAANVYGSSALSETAAGTATKAEPTGRGLVTRSLVDDRYLGLGPVATGVRSAVNNAQSTVFSTLTAGNAGTNGYKVVNSCNATAASLTALSITSTSNVFVNCTAPAGYVGTAPILGKTVVFAGSVKPPNDAVGVALPNADHVYVFGDPTKDAISLGNGSKLSVHTAGNLSGATCSNAQTASKAIMMVRAGDIKQTGGTLQLCNTSVIMMGGQPNGCLPTTSGTAPSQTPCGGGTGDGQLSQTGGNVDWTAPNQYDLMSLDSGDPNPVLAPGWTDSNGPEDLALWSESAGNSSSSTYNMNGGGTLHTVGVFMVPNADSFSIGGGAHQDLTNAQYVAASIALNGNTTSISMRVDPNSAITLPKLKMVGLVR